MTMKGFEGKANIDPLRREHLKEDVQPITACIGTRKDLGVWETKRKKTKKGGLEEQNRALNITDVDYYADDEKLSAQGFDVLTTSRDNVKVYVISPVDNTPKTSREYINCTGIIVVGQEVGTNENISFVSHQNPNEFFKSKDNFYALIKALGKRISELKERSEEGTIDVVIVGGNYFSHDGLSRTDYVKSIELLSFIVQQNLGFQPLVMTGPKTVDSANEGDHIFFDTKHRRLYIERSSVGDETSEPFVASKVKQQKDKWKFDI